ncbi:barstar family protein [Streptomyces sp. ISL-43]|uniref:barstar family protein n=1 Tax=Streptomyces sp. ISL-43 TaxID=2819183 RepID=UPI001BEC954A|nr:barstar family protein [Streptomyces sp. ISL-43]MBT2451964.1 barstar family protein [Streptomyces sp. ISL-43]
MNPDDTMVPMYRIADKGSRKVLVEAEGILGFFVDQDDPELGTVTLEGARRVDWGKGRSENAELHIVNFRHEVIGVYDLGLTRLAYSEAGTGSGEKANDVCSFQGYTCEYPRAGEVWRRWASPEPLRLGEWAARTVEYHKSWLHVAQTAWFTSHRGVVRCEDGCGVSLEGRRMLDKSSFYCELGEAANGAGGYFGSNLDALAHCLSANQAIKPLLSVEWRDFSASREFLGDVFVSRVIEVLKEFNVEVDCR